MIINNPLSLLLFNLLYINMKENNYWIWVLYVLFLKKNRSNLNKRIYTVIHGPTKTMVKVSIQMNIMAASRNQYVYDKKSMRGPMTKNHNYKIIAVERLCTLLLSCLSAMSSIDNFFQKNKNKNKLLCLKTPQQKIRYLRFTVSQTINSIGPYINLFSARTDYRCQIQTS